VVGRTRRDYRGEADLFGIYCHDREEVYVVPVEDVPPRAASLRLAPTRNGQSVGIRSASFYLLGDGQIPASLHDEPI
jgi:hypothetical protein